MTGIQAGPLETRVLAEQNTGPCGGVAAQTGRLPEDAERDVLATRGLAARKASRHSALVRPGVPSVTRFQKRSP